MHETVIAQQIVHVVRETMEARGAAAVRTIDVDLGQLEGLTPEALQGAFDLEARGTPLEGAVLLVRLVGARGYCPSCEADRPFELPPSTSHEIPAVACPECGRPLELLGGRGFTVQRASMVLEDP